MTAPTGQARQLADDLWAVDTLFRGYPGVIASYLLTGRDGLALVDVGSAVTLEQLFAGVRTAGFDPEQIRHLVLTHIHLDHAGASGQLVRRLPRARVYVHPVGAPHLIDPTKLLESAARIYGADMGPFWGEILPVPEERITMLPEGAELRVGQRTLRALHTPGHAIHHIAYHDAARNVVFAGDVAGVRLEGVEYVRPPTPPPDLSLEDWSASIERLLALRPATLYLAHYGPVDQAEAHLHELRARLAAWGALMLEGMRAGKNDAELAADLAATSNPELARITAGAAPEAIQRYEIAANYLMSAQGYIRYYRKHHPELLG